MHVHLPKAFHGWREFLNQYAIIVLGVLTALAGEQVVENLHYHSEMREAREALKIEIEADLWSIDNRVKMEPCLARRLADLDRWARSQNSARPLTLARPISSPLRWQFGTSVWRIATAGVVAKMPFQDRVDYAGIYDGLETYEKVVARTSDLWRDMSRISTIKNLNEEQIGNFLNDLQQLKINFDIISNDARFIIDGGAEKGLTPKIERATKHNLIQRQAGFCRPILTP